MVLRSSKNGLIFGFLFLSYLGFAQDFSEFIVVDQFGYPPVSKKIAIIRDLHAGFDAEESFEPGSEYVLVNADTDARVIASTIEKWNFGQTDDSSGDIVWKFDFSAITETGSYFVLDVDNNVRSYEFDISPAVYNEVLKHAVRTFFYQRVGYEKEAKYAVEAWADGASHMRDNPNRGFFEIRGLNNSQFDLAIIDMIGKTVFRGRFENKDTIDATRVLPGSLLKIEHENGTIIRKIIRS